MYSKTADQAQENEQMIPKKRIPTHPGEVLQEEFLGPLEIPQTRFAEHLRVPVQRINELINGKRGITPDTAWLLARALRTSPEFWMNLQAAYDLARSRHERLDVKPFRKAG
jgi:addiction module HigA family antidote